MSDRQQKVEKKLELLKDELRGLEEDITRSVRMGFGDSEHTRGWEWAREEYKKEINELEKELG